jgi:hypothetical protein
MSTVNTMDLIALIGTPAYHYNTYKRSRKHSIRSLLCNPMRSMQKSRQVLKQKEMKRILNDKRALFA